MKPNIYYCCVFVELHHPLIFYIFLFLFSFFFLNFSSPWSPPKKKKKTLLSLINPHLVLHFFQHFPSFSPFYLFTTLYFFLTPPSSFSLFYILTFLLPILFCIKFDIISTIQSIFFSHKTVSTLSLSLSTFFWCIFVHFYNSSLWVLSYNSN